MKTLTLDELACEAGVDSAYVRELIRVDALQPEDGARPYSASDVRRVQVLRSWEDAGFPAGRVLDLVRAGHLTMSWLEAPVSTRVERTGLTYGRLCREQDLPLAMVRAVYEALGFAPPEDCDRTRTGDRELASLVRMLLGRRVRAAAILGMLRVYAVGLRRIAKAESELYESEVEQPLRLAGRSEQELLDGGAQFMDVGALEGLVLDIYRREREHVWIEHRIAHAELALERAGLRQTSPPAICFVDLSGYTRSVEEHGDEVAARLAARLTPLVEDITRRHGGRPVRWLGDGGMFHFKDPRAAVLAALDIVECAPHAGLPPVHVGVHAGPVVFQDGDVYGKAVNMAARLAGHAAAGQVLVSDQVVACFSDGEVVFEALGQVTLKGFAQAVAVHRAVRGSPGLSATTATACR